MPHLSDLSAEYRNGVVIVGVDVYEKKTTSLKIVKAFVDSVGYRINYHVAAEDNNFMEAALFDAAGEQGILRSNAEGRLAWKHTRK